MASKPKTEINPGDPGTERASRKATLPGATGARKAAAGKAEPPREGNGLATLSVDELNAMIARAAYLRAQQRGFEPGHEVEDWLAAEAEIRAGMGGSRNKR